MDKNKIFAYEGQTWAAFQECREKEQRYLNDQRRKKEKRIIDTVTGKKSLQLETICKDFYLKYQENNEEIHTKISPIKLLNYKGIGKKITNYVQKKSECSLYC